MCVLVSNLDMEDSNLTKCFGLEYIMISSDYSALANNKMKQKKMTRFNSNHINLALKKRVGRINMTILEYRPPVSPNHPAISKSIASNFQEICAPTQQTLVYGSHMGKPIWDPYGTHIPANKGIWVTPGLGHMGVPT